MGKLTPEEWKRIKGVADARLNYALEVVTRECPGVGYEHKMVLISSIGFIAGAMGVILHGVRPEKEKGQDERSWEEIATEFLRGNVKE